MRSGRQEAFGFAFIHSRLRGDKCGIELFSDVDLSNFKWLGANKFVSEGVKFEVGISKSFSKEYVHEKGTSLSMQSKNL